MGFLYSPPWWQTAVIYQIYPRSFQDSDGDGVGDLGGILSRLPYLVELGVDALWVSPFYPSPMADFGYDVADYCGVDPMFGTMDDFDTLLGRAHELGLKVILDFVPNHTSSEHPWFLESRDSRESAKRDWYLWRDPAPGDGPPETRLPNNWMSHFGGPAWTWDTATGQFYLHSFLKEQPDLNWRNPGVRRAVYGAMSFWLDKGVDGFRMDVLWLLIKDALWRNNPPNPEWRPGSSSFGRFLPVYTADRPETHEIVAEMRALLESYEGERLLIGEIYLPIKELVRYYGSSVPEAGTEQHDLTTAAMTSPKLNGAQLPFNFHLIQTAWNAPAIAELIREYEAALPAGAWPNWVLGNHDQSRLATRIGAAQARVAAVLLLTLRGTPTMYYGDELGMADGSIPPEKVQDPAEKNQPGIGMGRDPERTPMLWSNVPNAGFTSGEPWLPVAEDFHRQTVQTENMQDGSMLKLYRALLRLRRTHDALSRGSVGEVGPMNGENSAVLRYRRSYGTEQIQVLLNFSNEPQNLMFSSGNVLLSTSARRSVGLVQHTLTLLPDEGMVVQINSLFPMGTSF